MSIPQTPRPVLLSLAAVLLSVLSPPRAVADDWPTFRRDVHRSGVTAEELDVRSLRGAWAWRSPYPPRPAWAGPAKWDAYAGIRGLRSMRQYDPCFHVIAVGDRVYFGSSVDDSVSCLDATGGRLLWSFVTDAPVRVAPTHAGGRIYFGSDDGHAYCVDATTGDLVWKFRPSPSGREIVHNGRFVSPWPCRTGVLVDGGTAYFAMSMLPWKESYLCAVDAVTGKPEGEGRYVRELSGRTTEGPLLATRGTLIAPQGRVPPLLFDRGTGAERGSLEGGGGSFVIVGDDSRILHGPGNKTGWITSSDERSRERVATFKNANAMAVAAGRAFVLTDHALSALDRGTRRPLWSVPSTRPCALIVAGKTAFTGGIDSVAAHDATSGKLVWTAPVDGRAYGLAVAGGALLVSTDTGAIHCFRATDEATAGATPVPASARDGDETATRRELAPVEPVDDPALVCRWVFRESQARGIVVEDLAGELDASVSGPVRFAEIGARQALALDGSGSVSVVEDHKLARLPERDITVEAWVRVDQPLEWGGIIGAIQDNGDFEKGWLLGFRQSSFCFALASAEKKRRLTYLTAGVAFRPGEWHHVAGTYDGETLRVYVDGELSGTSNEHAGPIDYPPRAFFEIGAYRDDDEFFPLVGMLEEVRVYGRALAAGEIREHARSRTFPEPAVEAEGPPPATLAAGPWLRFTGPDTAEVRWRTARPSPTALEYRLGETAQRFEDATPRTDHVATLAGLKHDRVYTYTIEVPGGAAGRETRRTREFECDTFFNFAVPPIPDRADPYAGRAGESSIPAAARRVLERTGVDRGICLVLGSGEGRLAYELARGSRLRVVGVDTSRERIAEARRLHARAGSLGGRVTFRHVESLAELPFTGDVANLIVSERSLTDGELPGAAREVARLLKPLDGVAYLGVRGAGDAFRQWLGGLEDGAGGARVDVVRDGDLAWLRLSRPELPGSGVWSHQYGRPDNSAFGGETLGGATGVDDLEVQWIGRPGPRAQPDRNGRKPSPLSVGGRLFTQGLQRLIGLDAHNGTVLWALEAPPLGRFNMPRDSSNWCADRDAVWAAVGDRCWKIDARTGTVVDLLDIIPGPRREWEHDWGLVAVEGAHLIGSAVKRGTAFTEFWGGAGAGWYDATSGPATFKVCSENVFSLSRETCELEWTHAGGVVINSTIAVTADRVYFAECRNRKVVESPERRVGLPELWDDLFLVALDLASGRTLWERTIEVPGGEVVFSLAHGEGRLVIVSSAKKLYHVHAFDAEDGEPLWDASFAWKKGDHGAHMSRPAIVGGRVFVRPAAFDLATGERLAVAMPDGGCGTYAATRDALVFRSSEVTVWDPTDGSASKWTRLRPDCWLSTIPAGGMLLSPEAGGGCSCGSWLETSVGFRAVRYEDERR